MESLSLLVGAIIPNWFWTTLLVIGLLWLAQKLLDLQWQKLISQIIQELVLLVDSISTGKWTAASINGLFIISMVFIGVLLIVVHAVGDIAMLLTNSIGHERATEVKQGFSLDLWILVTGIGSMLSVWALKK